MKLSIIIVNWNTKDLLKQCLESIVGGSGGIGDYEVIVVDNGSSDGSVDYVKSVTGIKLTENKQNLGFAVGNNVGIKKAKGNYIMLLNSDTIVQKNAIEILVDFLDRHSDIDIVGPKLLNIDRTPQSNCGSFPDLWVTFVMLFKEHFGGSNLVRNSPVKSEFVDWIAGTAFMARRKVFDCVGGLDEEIFMYMEEVEWFYRTKKAGLKTYFVNDSEIIHLGRGSSVSGKKDPILNIYKGLLHYFKKHRSPGEIFIVELMLKTKAFVALMIGFISNNSYLKETYGQAIKIS